MQKRGFIVVLLFIFVSSVYANECDNWQQAHPEWIWCDGFEDYKGDFMEWYNNSSWYSAERDDRGRIDISDEAFHGNYSLYMPAAQSSGYMGANLRFYDCVNPDEKYHCDLQGHEQLYIRTYVKFAPDHDFVHHFLNLGASQLQRDKFWDSMGLAGCRPNGVIGAGTTVDFNGKTRDSFFYTYSIDMFCHAPAQCGGVENAQKICNECAGRGLPCPEGVLECCWGNKYKRDEPALLPTGQWICLEMMMKLNTPGEHNGVMAYWINDELIHKETGMYWRTDPGLKMARAGLQHYIDEGEADHSNRVWWDNAVISTQRIGCVGYGNTSTPVIKQCRYADTDSDGKISNQELKMYIESWHHGIVNTVNLLDAVEKWKNGCP